MNPLRLRGMPLPKKALFACELALAILCIYRVYDYVTTGFFVSDEFGYYYAATHNFIYGGRWFFGDFNIALFKIPGLASPEGFAAVLPFYMFFWSGTTIYLFYKILLLLKFDDRTVALSLVSSFTLISFVLLSLGFLTEPVGLALAMGGIYTLLRFLRSTTAAGRLVFPPLTAILFGCAGATREPYDAFLIAGILLIGLVSLWQARRGGPVKFGRLGALERWRFGKKSFVVLSIMLFLIPAAFFYDANSGGTAVVPSIATQIVQAAVTNPSTLPAATTTSTSFGTSTSTFTTTQTVTLIVNGTTTHSITSATVTGTSTSATVVTTQQSYPFYAKSLLLNTLVIFIGGIALGWGPLAFLFGLAGFLILFRRSAKSRGITEVIVLLTSLVALGSYLVVSFIFAPIPSYFTFQNYSTILRFSDTALPAYFLMAPLFLTIVARSRKRVGALAVIVVSFLIVLVPVYQVYASSNFNFASGNPFQLGYRTDAVQVRDYISANLPNVQATMIAVPYGWTFTPGIDNLHSLKVYDVAANAQLPTLNASSFGALRPTLILIFDDDPTYLTGNAPWIAPFLNGTLGIGTVGGSHYTILTSQAVISNSAFKLVEDSVSWQ